MKIFIVGLCLGIGCTLLGFGTNWMIGLGVLFIQLTTILMMELKNDNGE